MNNSQKEIEKKFIIKNTDWVPLVSDSKIIYQAYFKDKEQESKRIRLVKQDNLAVIAYKKDIGLVNGFLERIEIENTIDYKEGLSIFLNCEKFLVKKRNIIKFDNIIIEVDEFLNLDKPLTMAEVEITHEQLKDVSNINFPVWCGKDVTSVKKYRNANLINSSTNHEFYLKELLEFPLNKISLK